MADSCVTPQTPLVDYDEAIRLVLEQARVVTEDEILPLDNALGRVLASGVTSPVNVPPLDNSAMDGYAVRAADLSPDTDTRLAVIGVAAAGRPFDGVVAAGQCTRILTGAPLPEGADTVVMQEQVTRTDDTATIRLGQTPGQHVRKAGEDIGRGDVALPAGVLLMPAELGMLASVGVSQVSVRRRPRVAFFSTGDELASRRHAELFLHEGRLSIKDLESTNGTQLNRVPMLECRLNNGDVITVGQEYVTDGVPVAPVFEEVLQ